MIPIRKVGSVLGSVRPQIPIVCRKGVGGFNITKIKFSVTHRASLFPNLINSLLHYRSIFGFPAVHPGPITVLHA